MFPVSKILLYLKCGKSSEDPRQKPVSSPIFRSLAAKLAERLRNKTSSDKQIPFRLHVLTGKDGGKNNEEQQFNKSEEHKKR